MKNLKSVLAVIAAVCLLACLTVPVFATAENVTLTSASTSNEAVSTEATTEATEDPADGLNGGQPAVEEDGDVSFDMDELQGAESEEDPNHVHAAEEESAGHKALRIVLTVLEVIASVALVGVVLVQSGKEAGLSGALSGNSDSYMSKGMRATLDKKLATMTKWVALVWVVLTLILSLI